jgi:DNA-binding response OmpR family regulator
MPTASDRPERQLAPNRPPGPPRSVRTAAGEPEGVGSAGLILVVEDDYFVGLANEQALMDAGYTVVGVVATGEEAIAMAARSRPDLVLMDIRLAGEMDGIDAAIALRGQGIPTLFASAHSDRHTRQRGEQAKPTGWLVKPFSDAELVAAVRAGLLRSASR